MNKHKEIYIYSERGLAEIDIVKREVKTKKYNQQTLFMNQISQETCLRFYVNWEDVVNFKLP